MSGFVSIKIEMDPRQVEIDNLLQEWNALYLQHLDLCMRDAEILMEIQGLVEREENINSKIAMLKQEMRDSPQINSQPVVPTKESSVARVGGKRHFPGRG